MRNLIFVFSLSIFPVVNLSPAFGAPPTVRISGISDASQNRWIATWSSPSSAKEAESKLGSSMFRENRGRYSIYMGSEIEVSQKLQSMLITPGASVALEPDIKMYPTATAPNDTNWTEQWSMQDSLESPYGISLPTARTYFSGPLGAGVRVAILDTGITDHPDLPDNPIDWTNRGWDFVDSDSDPHDPGDYHPNSLALATCAASNSSWHGTHVAGTIAAKTDNAVGVAGIAPGVELIIGRVLGECGGYLSDIASAIRWSAGLLEVGVPQLSNPAKIVNLSLGGSGSCSPTMQTAITDARNAGTLVVVAAGNSNVDVSNSVPANCNGVVAVAAVGQAGKRAYYSNYGTSVTIAAQGGDSTVNTPNSVGEIISTLNLGATTPGASGYVAYQGTSMATPHAVGVAALLLSAHPALTVTELTEILQYSSTAFPNSTGPNACANSSGVNSNKCGAGILNAGQALKSLGALENLSLPSISGTAKVNQTLTGQTGTWFGYKATFSGSWVSCTSAIDMNSCTDIAGTNSNTYNINVSQVDKYIRYKEIGTPYIFAETLTAYSAPTSIVLENVPPVLSSTSATGLSETGAILNFTSDESGTYFYLLYASGTAAPSSPTIIAQGASLAKATGPITAASPETSTLTGLSPGTSYKAYVVVRDAASNVSAISTISFTTPDTTPPNLSSATATSISDTGATLNFTSNEAGTYFYLLYDAGISAPISSAIIAQSAASPTLAKATGAISAATPRTSTLTGLTPGTSYKAYVVVRDAASNVSSIATIAFTTPDTTAPILSSVSASNISDTGATINFTSNEAGTYFYLLYASGSIAPISSAIIAQNAASPTIAKATGAISAASLLASDLTSLTPLTSYKAYVVVRDAASNVSSISTISFTTNALPDTTAPTITLETVTALTENTATIQFTSDESGTFFYLLYPDAIASPDTATIIAQGAASPTLARATGAVSVNSPKIVNLTGLVSVTSYKAYVVVRDSALNISFISTISFTTPDTTAPVLSGESFTSISDTGATLNFTSDESGTFFYLLYPSESASPDTATIIAQGVASPTIAKATGAISAALQKSSALSSLTALSSYKVYVVVRDAAENVSAILTISFTTIASQITGGGGSGFFTPPPAAAPTPATITVNIPSINTYTGNPQILTATTSPANLTYSLKYNGQSTAPTDVGSYLVKAEITDPLYSGTFSGTFEITKADPSINWTLPGEFLEGSTLTANELNATSLTSGKFSYIPDLGTVLSSANQNITATFIPQDSKNYNTISKTLQIKVTPPAVITPISPITPSQITPKLPTTMLTLVKPGDVSDSLVKIKLLTKKQSFWTINRSKGVVLQFAKGLSGSAKIGISKNGGKAKSFKLDVIDNSKTPMLPALYFKQVGNFKMNVTLGKINFVISIKITK